MTKVREGLFGNFIPLDRAVDAISAKIVVEVREIDGYRSVNSSKDENDFGVRHERGSVGKMLRQARAAGQLLGVVNRDAGSRPKWYDSSQGYPLLDDSLGREGRDILVQWMKQTLPPAPMPHGRYSSKVAPADPQEAMFQVPRSGLLGFDIDELIHFLDKASVPHVLGSPLNEVGDVPRASPQTARPDFRKLKFRTPLADALYAALERAANPYDAGSVLSELCKLAAEPDPKLRIDPLMEAVAGEVKWWDAEAETPRFLTRKQVNDFLRQVRKLRDEAVA